MAKGTGYKAGGRAGLIPDPQWWLEQIRKGIEDRNKKTHRPRWEQWRKWYRGYYSRGDIPANVYFKMLRTMVPRVYFRNPSVSITPRKHQEGQLDYWLFSQLLEQVDNALYDRIKLKKAVKRAVQDAFMFGTGVLKLGYGGQFNTTPDPVEPTEAPTTKRGHRVEYNSFILPDTPWTLRVPTGRFIVPAHTLDWESSRWAAHEERRHVDDVQDDDRFKHVSDITPGVLTTPGEEGLNKLADQVSMIEIRDKKSGDVFVIAPQQKNKVLAQEDDLLQFGSRLPYFPIQFNPDDDTFWAVPDAMILEPHQLEVNSIRRVIRMHRRISVIKYLIKQGAIGPDQIAKLANADDVGATIEFDKDIANFDSVFKLLQGGDIPAALIKAEALEEQTIQEILGLGVNQFGEYAPGSADRSATEAMIVNQATQIRSDERRDIVADTIVDMTEHMNYVILQKWDTKESVASIIGPGDQEIWVSFRASELRTLEYDVKIDPDSSVPETRQVRRQNAKEVMATFGQNQNMDGQKLTKWGLTEMGGPSMLDLMLNGGKPMQPMVQPGQPGSTANNPVAAPELIRQLAERKQNGSIENG